MRDRRYLNQTLVLRPLPGTRFEGVKGLRWKRPKRGYPWRELWGSCGFFLPLCRAGGDGIAFSSPGLPWEGLWEAHSENWAQPLMLQDDHVYPCLKVSKVENVAGAPALGKSKARQLDCCIVTGQRVVFQGIYLPGGYFQTDSPAQEGFLPGRGERNWSILWDAVEWEAFVNQGSSPRTPQKWELYIRIQRSSTVPGKWAASCHSSRQSKETGDIAPPPNPGSPAWGRPGGGGGTWLQKKLRVEIINLDGTS